MKVFASWTGEVSKDKLFSEKSFNYAFFDVQRIVFNGSPFYPVLLIPIQIFQNGASDGIHFRDKFPIILTIFS